MRRANVAALAVIMGCLSVASCQKAPAEETTQSSVSETSEKEGISVGDIILAALIRMTPLPVQGISRL